MGTAVAGTAGRMRDDGAPTKPDVARVHRLALLLDDLDRTLRAGFKRTRDAPDQVTWDHHAVLTLLSAHAEGAPSQAVIAAALQVTGPTVVRIIDVLERKGLVARHRDQRDRRRVRVTLTARGAQVQRACAAHHEQHLATLLERLPLAMQDSLLLALSAVVMDRDDSGTGAP